MAADPVEPHAPEDDDIESHILAVHLGHAANCSSVGSVVDFLFVSAVAGAALMAIVAATLDSGRATTEAAEDDEDAKATSPSEE